MACRRVCGAAVARGSARAEPVTQRRWHERGVCGRGGLVGIGVLAAQVLAAFGRPRGNGVERLAR
eukprot:13766368-Alexandrium_andersonii.AAC.1